jgi:hypothetical protein
MGLNGSLADGGVCAVEQVVYVEKPVEKVSRGGPRLQCRALSSPPLHTHTHTHTLRISLQVVEKVVEKVVYVDRPVEKVSRCGPRLQRRAPSP